MEQKKKDKGNIILIAIAICVMIGVIISVTYAAYYWASPNNSISGTTDCFIVEYVKGNDIGSDNDRATLNLAADYTGGLSSTAKVSISNACNINSGTAVVYLTSDDTSGDYLINLGILNYNVFVNNHSVCSGEVTSKGKNIICEDIFVDDKETEIKVYVWLNGELATDDNYSYISSEIYKGYIDVSVIGR